MLSAVRGAFTRHLLVGLLALLVLAVAAWMLNRRVAGPLRALIDATVRAGREPDGARVGEAGTAELVTLAREFNAMLDVRAGHEAQLSHQATHDPLTGLANKRLLGDRLAHALHGAAGRGLLRRRRPARHRHRRIRPRRRRPRRRRGRRAPGRGRGSDATLARFGGAEFVVLSARAPGTSGAVAERLLRCLDRPFSGPAADIVLKAAVGVAVSRDQASSPEQLLREADSAMREARAERSRLAAVRPPDAGARDPAPRRRARPLAGAPARGAARALPAAARHRHADRRRPPRRSCAGSTPSAGSCPRSEFIPTAEETGQISAIGRFVLTRACGRPPPGRAAGHPLRISVNVAVGQLRDEAFPAVVQQTLGRTRGSRRASCASRSPSRR